MLDQRRIAGVGNIYADEALFRARIHPLRAAGRLTRADWERVREGIEEALSAGIEAKGASIDDFRHVDGARGSFQDQFLVHRRAGRGVPAVRAEIRKIVVGEGGRTCASGVSRSRAPVVRAMVVRAMVVAPRPGERSLRREKLAEPSGAVRRDKLVEPADRLFADQDLREREHPGSARPTRHDRPGRVPD